MESKQRFSAGPLSSISRRLSKALVDPALTYAMRISLRDGVSRQPATVRHSCREFLLALLLFTRLLPFLIACYPSTTSAWSFSPSLPRNGSAKSSKSSANPPMTTLSCTPIPTIYSNGRLGSKAPTILPTRVASLPWIFVAVWIIPWHRPR